MTIQKGRNSWTTCSVSCRSGVSLFTVSVISNGRYLDLTTDRENISTFCVCAVYVFVSSHINGLQI
jgi:hypothetical protein